MQDVNDGLITMQEAATRLCVTTQTVRTWGRMGLIRLIRLPRGMFRVPRSEVDRILATEEVNYESANKTKPQA